MVGSLRRVVATAVVVTGSPFRSGRAASYRETQKRGLGISFARGAREARARTGGSRGVPDGSSLVASRCVTRAHDAIFPNERRDDSLQRRDVTSVRAACRSPRLTPGSSVSRRAATIRSRIYIVFDHG